jgi:uncharacterized repeat protein (TIGR03803 family)
MLNTRSRSEGISNIRRAASPGAALALAATVVLALITTHSAQAAEAPLYSFCAQSSCTDGQYPIAALVQGTDGNFYGTTFQGGANSSGTIFQITPSGTLTTLHNFCPQSGCADGRYLYAPLVQGTDGNFYGATFQGGTNNDTGTVFQITPSGALKTLYSFCALTGCADGRYPYAGLVQGTDGNFYGTTLRGGGPNDSGTVFQITPSGTLKTLYSFCPQSGCADGQYPYAGLVQGADGNFYGTTQQGGSNSNSGTVFKITSSGALTTLYSFCAQSGCADGMNPYAGLIQGADGNFYGTAYLGGTDGVGTVFRITPTGTLTTLHSFCPQSSCADGAEPDAGLVQGSDGNFYGATVSGGTSSKGQGTLFQITSSGSLTTLYRFCPQSGCADGQYPYAGLVQGSDGNFYGTTYQGGANNQGAVFKLIAPTATSLTSSLNPSTYGQSVTFTATVSSALGTPTGSVTFMTGTRTLGSTTLTGGVASLARTNISAGTNSITAVYAGSTNFSGSTSSPLSQVVTQATTNVTLTSSLNPSTFGQSVTFTATVAPQFHGAPGGRVTFKSGNVTLGIVKPIGGVASLTTTTLGAGTDSITAVYSGNANFSGSTSSALSQGVNQATSTVTLTSSQNPSSVGQSVTFTATVMPQFSGTPTGRVVFKNGSATLGTVTLVGGVATLNTSSLTSGAHTITARYNGSKNFSASSTTLTQTVN